MKQLLLTLLISISIQFIVYGQSLTIEETIRYINKVHYENRPFPTSKSYDRLKLYKDGRFESYNFYSGWKYEMHVSDVAIWRLQNEFQIRCKKPESAGFGYVPFNNKCIKVSGKANLGPTSSISVGLDDAYTTKKLFNAYRYLFAKIEEDGSYVRVDDDPFAPKNFNPNSLEIKGINNCSSINLDKINGVYYLDVNIGGVTKKFILDSGASDISISIDYEKELMNKGVFQKEHYITPALYKIADGTVIQCRRLIIPEIKIGSYIVKNVTASIGINGTQLLLGKSLLDKFKKWTIDNTSHTLILER